MFKVDFHQDKFSEQWVNSIDDVALSTKHCLSAIQFEKGEKSQIPIILDKSGFQVKAKGGCWIKLVENNTEEHGNWMNSQN
uniref:Uncharacterized protein n=1 Tax=Megaselia scalaris TaxID=36166 RepID=T1GHQ3_MEGSC